MLCEQDIRHLIIHGLGVEGRAALNWFLAAGIPYVVCIDTAAKFAALPEETRHNPALSHTTEANFNPPTPKEDTLYLRSPGVPPTNPVFTKIRNLGIQHSTPTGWWLAMKAPTQTITITGTKGKSTTASLTANLLRWAGKDAREMGNIGLTPFDKDISPDTICVLELSSYMMHDLPPVRTFHTVTNIYKEHTDWHGTHAAYRHDKLRPFLIAPTAPGILPQELQTETSLDATEIVSFEDIAPIDSNSIILPGSAKPLTPADLNPAFTAPSMLLSLRASIATCLAAGLLQPEEITEALSQHLPSWSGLPSRQSIIPSTDGITYVDDTLATVPEATLSALTRWQGHTIHLLLGGADRGQDLTALIKECARRPEIALYAFSQTSDKIRSAAEQAGIANRCHYHQTLESMFTAAREAAQKGDVILFSPAAPSAPPHANFAQRSTIFKSFVPQG